MIKSQGSVSIDPSSNVEVGEQGGRKYRRAFRIEYTISEGTEAHSIILRSGATTGDLYTADTLVENAMKGRFDGWRCLTAPGDEPTTWVLDDWVSRPDAGSNDTPLVTCSEPLCIAGVHPWRHGAIDGAHQLNRMMHPTGAYSVHGEKLADEDEDSPAWVAWVDASDLPDGAEGVRVVQQMANDFAAMQARCDAMNKSEVAA